MTEKEIGRALLALDMTAAGAPDPRQLTRQILARDRRRIRLLAGLATLFWILAAAGIISLLCIYLFQVPPRLRAYEAGRAQLQNDWEVWATVGEWAARIVVVCMLTVLVAATSTVLLILLSRRATLRQINASLMEISEQLKLLRMPPAGAPGESSGAT